TWGLENLRRRIDGGGNFVVTQLFFDNEDFYRFREQARLMGINCPIIAGIMPVLNVAQIKRFISMCGAKIPHPLLLAIENVEGDAEAVYRIGVDHAIDQCRDLLKNATERLHFYTLNKSKARRAIARALDAK